MDYFTHVIIRKPPFSPRASSDSSSSNPGNELRAVTAHRAPDPAVWAFSDVNDRVFSDDKGDPVSPQEWMRRGLGSIHTALVV